LISLAQYCQVLADEAEPKTIKRPKYHARFGALRALMKCFDGAHMAHSQRA
jgi:hypothetical protein